MLLLKQLKCGRDTLVLIAQTAEEGKTLIDFTGHNEPLYAEITRLGNYQLPDLVIRKERDWKPKT